MNNFCYDEEESPLNSFSQTNDDSASKVRKINKMPFKVLDAP